MCTLYPNLHSCIHSFGKYQFHLFKTEGVLVTYLPPKKKKKKSLSSPPWVVHEKFRLCVLSILSWAPGILFSSTLLDWIYFSLALRLQRTAFQKITRAKRLRSDHKATQRFGLQATRLLSSNVVSAYPPLLSQWQGLSFPLPLPLTLSAGSFTDSWVCLLLFSISS